MTAEELINAKPCARLICAFNRVGAHDVYNARRTLDALLASPNMNAVLTSLFEGLSFKVPRKDVTYRFARALTPSECNDLKLSRGATHSEIGLYYRFPYFIFCPAEKVAEHCARTQPFEHCEGAFLIGGKISIGFDLGDQTFELDWNFPDGDDGAIKPSAGSKAAAAERRWGESHSKKSRWKVWVEVLSTRHAPDGDDHTVKRNNLVIKKLKKSLKLPQKIIDAVIAALPADLQPAVAETSRHGENAVESVFVSASTSPAAWEFKQLYANSTDAGEPLNTDPKTRAREVSIIVTNLDDIIDISRDATSNKLQCFWCNLEEGLSGLFATKYSKELGQIFISGRCFLRDPNRLSLLGKEIDVRDVDISAIVTEALMRDIVRWH